jgi:hypothetical protein
MKKYGVDECEDDIDKLRRCLDRIAEEGGRIVTVVWQPSRNVQDDPGTTMPVQSGYIVVYEHD